MQHLCPQILEEVGGKLAKDGRLALFTGHGSCTLSEIHHFR